MKKQHGFSTIEALLILIIAGIVGFTGWYVFHIKQTANNNLNSANSVSNTLPAFKNKSAGTAQTSSTAKSSTTPSSSTNTYKTPASSQQTGIAMSVNPNHGPVGTKVSIQISGIQDTTNLKLALTDSRSDYDNKGLTIQPSDVHNGNYSGTYTIPSSVVNIYSGCPRICYANTATGVGHIILTHGQNSAEYISAAFTVE